MAEDVEIWRQSSVAGLEVSSRGRILVTPYSQEMPYGGTRQYGNHPWPGVLAKDGTRPRRIFRFRGKTHKVHRLVCEAFHGPAPFLNADVLHRNGVTIDNVETNLRWATRAEILSQPRLRIVGVAVRHAGLIITLPAPARHGDLLHPLHDLTGAVLGGEDQGFLTSTGYFIGRALAAEVAKAIGQITEPQWPPELYSEDLW